jgi:hypothetical protein
LGALVVVGALAAAPLAAQKQDTWTGVISDSNCNGKHAADEHGGKKTTDADCTIACVKKGAKYVFVSDGKIFKLANQSSKQIAAHAGQRVELTGTMSGDTITAKTMKATK